MVKAFALEHRHHTLVLHPAVRHKGIQNDLSVRVHVLQRLPGNLLQKLRNGEEGAAGKPTAHVVVGEVVEQTLCRNCHDVVLQVFQVAHTYHFLHGARVSEYKVAESEVAVHAVAQIHAHLLRVLVNEVCVALFRQLGVLRFVGVHDERNVWVFGTYGAKQLESGIFALFRAAGLHGEAAVADDA